MDAEEEIREVKEWSDGVMEYWSNGVMEDENDGETKIWREEEMERRRYGARR